MHEPCEPAAALVAVPPGVVVEVLVTTTVVPSDVPTLPGARIVVLGAGQDVLSQFRPTWQQPPR